LQQYNFIDFLSRFNNDVENMEILKVMDELPDIKDEGVWLAGGAIRRTLNHDLLDSDFDFFFADQGRLRDYRDKLKSKGAKELHKNDHQETLSIKVGDKTYLIQLVKIGYYKDVAALLDSFDFTITQFAYDGENLYCGDYSLWDLPRKKLALHKLTYGVATMRRMLKYTSQGFTACAGTMKSILEAVVENPEIVQSDVQYID